MIPGRGKYQTEFGAHPSFDGYRGLFFLRKSRQGAVSAGITLPQLRKKLVASRETFAPLFVIVDEYFVGYYECGEVLKQLPPYTLGFM